MNGEPNTLERSLAELEARLRSVGAPVLAGLKPGAEPTRVRKLLSAAGIDPDPGLVALYSWHDGADERAGDLLLGARFPSVKEAIESWRFELQLAKENEFLPEFPAASFFDPGWFPILADIGGLLYVVERSGAGRVLLVDRTNPTNPEELAPSLISFVDGIAHDGLDFKPQPLSADAAILVAKLESSDSNESWSAARELTRKKPQEAFEPIVAMLRNKSRQARIYAALILGELGNIAAIAPLQEVLNTEADSGVQTALQRALTVLGEPPGHQA